MGKPRDPGYWKKWRASHPEYRERERERLRHRDRSHERLHRDYKAEYAVRARLRGPVDDTPLAPLFPEMHHGTTYAFWDEELRMDLRQEAFLAVMEGRDPEEAVREYARREVGFHRTTCSYDSLIDTIKLQKDAS